MRTARQREASRINDARSRGPVTSIGKQKPSRNSRRHGLYSNDLYATDIPTARPSGHEADELSDMHGALEAQYPSQNSPASEYDRLLQCVVDAHRDRMRIVALETRIKTVQMARQRLIHPGETETNLATFSFCRLADETGTLHALDRFEGVMTRRWERAQRT